MDIFEWKEISNVWEAVLQYYESDWRGFFV